MEAKRSNAGSALARRETKIVALVAALAAMSATTLGGCHLAGDIFKAGFWVAILSVLLVVGILAGAVAMLKR